MSEYIIEKNIPITPSKRGVSSPFTIAIRSLQVGDSFVCPKKRITSVGVVSKVAGVKCTTRTINKDSIRVWRIK